MFRFARPLAAGIALASCIVFPASAQVTVISPDLHARVHSEAFSVTLNGVDVSQKSTFYLAEDGTIYAGAKDLIEWDLKFPVDSAFARDGEQWYGLQTQLRLAVTVRRPQERLEIVAPPTAFIGGPETVRGPFATGGGAFLNYKIDRTTGEYNMFFTRNASGLVVDYGSMQSSSSLSFARELTKIYSIDVKDRLSFELGEGQVEAPPIGTSANFLGLHVGSDFESDPAFVTKALPSVRGVAPSPSVVEVYVNNILQWREEVPTGPFVIRNLPPSATYSDVILVITDATGHRITQVVRPSVDQGLLRPGLTSFSLDAGWGEDTFSSQSPQYKDPIASTTLRHGVTTWMTLQGMAESMAGENFAALGFEMRPGFGQQLTYWYGDGNMRRTGSLNYSLSVGGVRFSERMGFNSRSQPDDFNPDGIFSRYTETSQISITNVPNLSLDLGLDRAVSNTGPPEAMYSMDASYNLRWFTITLRPRYDRYAHVVSAEVELQQRLGDIHELREIVQRPAGQPAGTEIQYTKQNRDPDDPWSYSLREAMGQYESRSLTLNNQMPWADARILAQDQAGRGNIQAELNGAVQAVGNTVSATRVKYNDEVVGLARLPGFPGVRIEVNDSPAGVTDKNGNLVLRNLGALEENTITADLSNIPLAVTVKDPVQIEPLPSTPVTIDLLESKAQSIRVRIVDANGSPLPAAGRLESDDGRTFPIGFDGNAYIYGMTPGAHTFSADSPRRCTFSLDFKPVWEIVDAGTKNCR